MCEEKDNVSKTNSDLKKAEHNRLQKHDKHKHNHGNSEHDTQTHNHGTGENGRHKHSHDHYDHEDSECARGPENVEDSSCDNEGGCGCGSGHSHGAGGNLKVFLIRLIVSLSMTVVLAVNGYMALFDIYKPIEILLYLCAYMLAGYEVVFTALRNITKGRVFDENFLMTIASAGAFAIGEMSEAAAVMIFYGIGELLQDLAVSRSKRNIKNLMDIRPDYANLKSGDGLITVSPQSVSVGDIIVVRAGEKIPLDGVVISGQSFVDTVALTGESVPREVIEGDAVLSGSLNTSGVIEIRVEKTFGQSTVSKILELVENAGSKKAKSEKFITKFARIYTPVVVLVAVLLVAVPSILNPSEFSEWLYKGLSFLIISCPCALVISIPVGFFGGIGGAARKGVLVKGANYLESLNNLSTVVLDKTGTLTKGTFTVTEVITASGVSEEELIYTAATAEKDSNHPIAKSIREYYGKSITEVIKTTERAGYGIIAESESGVIHAGNSKLMGEIGITDLPDTKGKTTVYVALGGRYFGALVISDEVKPGTPEALERIRRSGIDNLIMLTGDREGIAREISQELGLSDYRAELLPQDKVREFEKILDANKGKGLSAFVGDGINDAPVLTRADIGIAMGGVGSDAAIEAADIVIMNDDIGRIADAIKVAKKTRKIVIENIVFALGIKTGVMLLSVFMGLPILAAIFADVGVALLCVVNSLRAMK